MGDVASPSRVQRGLVLATLALLLGAGVREVEAWPLTAWRLFSAPRTDQQSGWVVETSDRDGSRDVLSLHELPLGYRSATSRLAAAVRDGSGPALCSALLVAAVEQRPDAVELRVYRDRQRLVRAEDGWRTEHDRTEVLGCAARG